MKALSLSRPWPYAILHLGKRIENRSDKRGMPPMCNYRGPLLLHAAKSWDKDMPAWLGHVGIETPATLFTPSAHPSGVIFGRCDVVGHIKPKKWTFRTQCRCAMCGGIGLIPPLQASALPLDLRWWMGDYALILANVEATPLVPCKGSLGLWTVPDDIARRAG